MDINNPANLMNFFLDNTVGGGQGEYSSGQVALIQLYNGILGADQIAQMAMNPFASAVPEPSSLILLAIGAVALGTRQLRRPRPA